MNSTLINRVVVGALVATSALLSTNYLLAQTTAPAATAPSTQAASKILAIVNGREIDSEKFNELLTAVAGMRLFEQVIDLIVAEQACVGAGVDISETAFKPNVKAELDRALGDIKAPAGVVLSEADRLTALNQILRERGVTNVEFQMGLRRGACLRALAKDKVTISKDDVQNAFDIQYGERLRGRVFVVRTMEESSDIRKAIVEQGKDINEVAAAHNGQNFILPMLAKDENLQKLKAACVNLKEKQLAGPITQKNETSLLFYLEKRDPKQDVQLDSTLEKKLRADLQEQGERVWANNHLRALRQMANIRINDPILSKQYEEVIRAMQANTSQPASAPATMK